MSKLVEERKNRINYMLHETEENAKMDILEFENMKTNNPQNPPKLLFEKLTWRNIADFLAVMARGTGLRERIVNEYFDILRRCGDLEINHKNSHYFRNASVIRSYLAEHPELA